MVFKFQHDCMLSKDDIQWAVNAANKLADESRQSNVFVEV